ncbi:MAG: TlpA disulfide reductase family protein [Pyrinomonadaceae bacterium]
MTSAQKPARSAVKKFWTPARLTLSFVALSLIAIVGAASCSNHPAEVSNSNSSYANTRGPATSSRTAPPVAPAFITVPDELRETAVQTIEGSSFKLADLNGKVVVVNLWATWCGPCRIETPELVKVSDDYKSKGVEVVGLTTRGNDPDVEKVKDFVREQNVRYRTIYEDGTLASSLVQLVHGRGAIPQSWVISRDGRILKHFIGFSPTETPPKLREAIDQALNDKTGT